MVDNNEKDISLQQGTSTSLPDRNAKWVSGVTGGVASAFVTILFLVIPVVNTWLENTKQVQVLQIKNTAEQVEYITKRMQDSDKERDLYKSEMIEAQKELRECKLKKS